MNSFRSVFRALEHEAERQVSVIESGGRIVQETRGWVETDAITVSQRTKEGASDYRYFPEPDLPPLMISREWVEEIGASLPELPHQKNSLQKGFATSYRADLERAARYGTTAALTHSDSASHSRK